MRFFDSASTLQNNYTSTTGPSVNDDNTLGYGAGSRWLNTTTGEWWSAISVATGAAVWVTPGNYTATTDPVVGSDNTLGYAAGSRWFNTTLGKWWKCISAATGAAVWTTEGISQHPGYVTGGTKLYLMGGGTSSSGTAVPAVDTIYIYPWFVRSKLAASAINLRVVTGVGSTAVKSAIWANGPSGTGVGRPLGAPLAVDNTGQATTGSGTTTSATISLTLNPGVYWFGAKFNGAPSMKGPANTNTSLEELIGVTTLATNALIALSIADAYANSMPTFTGSESWSELQAAGSAFIWLTAT